MAGLCAPLPTLRRRPYGLRRTARGRYGSLLLHRIGLAPTARCRSPGALRKSLYVIASRSWPRVWRNRAEFIHGREAIEAFLTRKWNRELDYRLIKEVWTCRPRNWRSGQQDGRAARSGSATARPSCNSVEGSPQGQVSMKRSPQDQVFFAGTSSRTTSGAPVQYCPMFRLRRDNRARHVLG